MKKRLLFVMIFLIIILSACANTNKLKTGRYVCDNKAELRLEDDNKFILYALILSTTPAGSYEEKDDKLILTTHDDHEYVFLIEDGTLVFESGEWLEHWVEQGASFYLSEE